MGPAYERTGLNRLLGSIQQCFCEELSAASDFRGRRLEASIFLLIARTQMFHYHSGPYPLLLAPRCQCWDHACVGIVALNPSTSVMGIRQGK